MLVLLVAFLVLSDEKPRKSHLIEYTVEKCEEEITFDTFCRKCFLLQKTWHYLSTWDAPHIWLQHGVHPLADMKAVISDSSYLQFSFKLSVKDIRTNFVQVLESDLDALSVTALIILKTMLGEQCLDAL